MNCERCEAEVDELIDTRHRVPEHIMPNRRVCTRCYMQLLKAVTTPGACFLCGTTRGTTPIEFSLQTDGEIERIQNGGHAIVETVTLGVCAECRKGVESAGVQVAGAPIVAEG